VDEGAISILRDEIKRSVIEAYVAMGAANSVIESTISPLDGRVSRSGSSGKDLDSRLEKCAELIDSAYRELLKFLSGEENG
jgi:hypothetical protein